MKTKLLLCFMALGMLSAAASVTKNRTVRFFQAESPHPIVVKQMNNQQNDIIAATERTKVHEAHTEQAKHQVDFVLSFDTELQSVSQIQLISKDNYFDNDDLELYELQDGSNIMSVPDGCYDIIVTFNQFKPNGWMPIYMLFVIREQITIDKDITINISANEAKNHIDFQTLTIDGEPVNTGKYYVDEDGNRTTVDEGNTDDVIWFSYLISKEYGRITTIRGNFGSEYEGAFQQSNYEQLADFYVNDVSDRFVFYSYRAAHKGHSVYTSAYEVEGATGNVTVSNEPSDFTLFEDYFPSPGYDDENTYMSFEQYCESQTEAGLTNGVSVTLSQPLESNEKCKYFIGTSANTSQVGMVPIIRPMRSSGTEIIMPWGIEVEYQPIMRSTPVAKTDGIIEFVNNGIDVVGNNFSFHFENTPTKDEHSNEIGDIYRYSDYPGHPVFAYDVQRKNGVFCNNSPIMISSPYQKENNRNLQFLYDYIGRYGENKPTDVANSNLDIKSNGETIYSGKGKNYISLEAMLNGEVVATITNETVIDNDLAGINKSKLFWIAGADDECPPTLTMLHFRDDNGDVTDRFATSAEGTLEFSAADYNTIFSELGWICHDRYEPEGVEVSYSPYGEDAWTELEVEEVPEYYWPVMGWFYTSSLADVTGEALNGWFDLKIRLTDTAGNWQEQVISPAFQVENQAISAVNAVRESNAHEIARYNVTGQRVDSSTNGIVIMKMSDGTARKVFVP